MEDEKDLMSIFGSGMELNYDGFTQDNDDQPADDADDQLQDQPID